MVHLGSDTHGVVSKQWRIKVGPPEATKTCSDFVTNEFFGFSEKPLEGHLHLKSLAEELLVALLS